MAYLARLCAKGRHERLVPSVENGKALRGCRVDDRRKHPLSLGQTGNERLALGDLAWPSSIGSGLSWGEGPPITPSNSATVQRLGDTPGRKQVAREATRDWALASDLIDVWQLLDEPRELSLGVHTLKVETEGVTLDRKWLASL